VQVLLELWSFACIGQSICKQSPLSASYVFPSVDALYSVSYRHRDHTWKWKRIIPPIGISLAVLLATGKLGVSWKSLSLAGREWVDSGVGTWQIRLIFQQVLAGSSSRAAQPYLETIGDAN